MEQQSVHASASQDGLKSTRRLVIHDKWGKGWGGKNFSLSLPKVI